MSSFYRDNYFLIRRLHSLSGIIPVGAFFMVHMLLNSRAAQGPQEYQWVPDTLGQIPGLLALELGGIILPILFHAVVGFIIIVQGEPNSHKKKLGFYANFAYTMQRVTGVLLFFLIGLHLYQTWWPHQLIEYGPNAGQQHYDIFGQMSAYMGENGWLIMYSLFVLIAAYHFGNGIFNFLFKWGFSTSPSSQRKAIAVGLLIGLVFFGIGMAGVWGLRFSDHAKEYERGTTPGIFEEGDGLPGDRHSRNPGKSISLVMENSGE